MYLTSIIILMLMIVVTASTAFLSIFVFVVMFMAHQQNNLLQNLIKFCILCNIFNNKFIYCNFLILIINRKMPELPQVQTVRKFLSQVLLKPKPKKIMTIKLYYPGIVKQIEPKQYIQTLLGQTFKQIDRYGKYLILKLNKNSIISHLRMQGKYSFHQKKPQIGKHDHVQFLMTDGSSLIYSDVRKFGTMYLTKKGQQFQHPSIRKLGPQINNSSTFTQQYLSEICKKKNGNIKNILLDQQIICGAGNIYADEILFASKIHPEKNIQKLNSVDIKNIVKFGKSIIDQAIFNKGTTFRSFSSNHQKGNNQDFLKVYGKDHLNCEVCGFKIQKIKLGGRGTHFCNNCQKK